LQAQPLTSLELVLVGIDGRISGAIVRVALGLAMPPLFRASTGGYDPIWGFPVFFVAVLVALRVVPALLRFVLPFSREVKGIWAERRAIAKRYDSYQWQKLFWFGLGLLPHAIIARGGREAELIVTIICLIGGSIGLFVWRRVSSAHSAQQY
jgi:hypothetical protein